MTTDKILNYCLQNLEGTVLVESWGEKGIFYNPDHVLKRGVYILTVKEKDGDNDKGSGLNRENVYRVNLGIPWILAVNMTRLVPSLRDPHIFLPAYREVLQSLRNGLHLQPL